jgi:hypothetical protein
MTPEYPASLPTNAAIVHEALGEFENYLRAKLKD